MPACGTCTREKGTGHRRKLLVPIYSQILQTEQGLRVTPNTMPAAFFRLYPAHAAPCRPESQAQSSVHHPQRALRG